MIQKLKSTSIWSRVSIILKCLISSNQEISGDMLEMGQSTGFQEYDMEQLMSIKDPEANVTFYVKDGKTGRPRRAIVDVRQGKQSKPQPSKIEFNGRSIRGGI